MAAPVVHTAYSDGAVITASGGCNAAGTPAYSVITNTYDASRCTTAATDSVVMLTIPARTYVQSVFYEVLLGDATQTADIGDGDDPNGWVPAADVATTGNSGCSSIALTNGTNESITGYTGGKYYATADTIDLTVPSGKAWDVLKLRVSAAAVMFG